LNKIIEFNILMNSEKSGRIGFVSPSNIAIIKYWGKYPGQIPANPSVSFTLKNAVTEMITEFYYHPQQSSGNVELFFEGHYHPDFTRKIEKFIQKNQILFPLAAKCSLKIQSKNSFPHSAGIASSASSMSALALSLYEINSLLTEENTKWQQNRTTVSSFARLASGSACRSVFEGIALWGKSSLINISSNDYAIPLVEEINPVFKTFKDVILIVDEGTKSVSSSSGHALMENNPYSASRYLQANKNLEQLLFAFKTGELDLFCKISENEALSLQSLMLMSEPWYMLIKPDTVRILQEIKTFREQKKLPVCFTIDAGPNVHLLFPESVEKEIMLFINYLSDICGGIKWLEDGIGTGPKQINFDNEYN